MSKGNNDRLVVGFYVRVSTDEQSRDNNSWSIQIDKCVTMLDQYSADLGRYIDHGEERLAVFQEDYSGAEYNRPEMDKLRALCEKGIINAIFVSKIDRFARDELVQMLLERWFKDRNIRLFSATEGEFTPGNINRLVASIHRAQAEDDRVRLLDRMKVARRTYAEQGIPNGQGKAAFGYVKTGKKSHTQWVIMPEQAEIVLTICEWNAYERIGATEIAKRLNAANVPTPTQAKGIKSVIARDHWTQSNVRKILERAQVYAGTLIAYKWQWDDKKHQSVLRDESEQVVIQIPPIISQELADAVDTMRVNGKRLYQAQSEKHDFLLARRLRCSGRMDNEHICNYAISSLTLNPAKGRPNPHYYYRCNSTSQGLFRTNCGLHSINAEYLDFIAWDFIQRLLTDTRGTVEKYKQAQANIEADHKDARLHIAAIDGLIKEHSDYYDSLQRKYARDMLEKYRDNVSIWFEYYTGDYTESALGTMIKEIGSNQSLIHATTIEMQSYIGLR